MFLLFNQKDPLRNEETRLKVRNKVYQDSILYLIHFKINPKPIMKKKY